MRPNLRDLGIMILLLAAAYAVSLLLLPNTGVENNSALIFVVAVTCISRLTEGYIYGVVASVLSVLLINFSFMVPYNEFNLALSGYPVAMVSMLVPALMVSTLTAQLKKHMKQKAAMELETAKAGIRSNILLAVSHDLRTPLTAISGSASYILSQGEQGGCSEENLKLISDIKQDAEWLTVMVENILSVTKLRDSGASLTLKPEILEEIIGSSIIKIQRRFPECQVNLDLSEEILIVPMDPLLMEQVLLNLIENGFRHSGTIKPMLLSTRREGHKALVTLRDFGKGLPEDVMEQIQQEKPVVVDRRGDSYRGMGIGLSVCQSILKAHDSVLKARNEPEGGACFYFYLNLVEEDTYVDETENIDRGR